MNFLSLFVAIPVLMMLVLLVSRSLNGIRAVMVTGATLLLGLAVMLVYMYIGERGAGNSAEMLFCADRLWFEPLNIHYVVGVDGISVVMLLLSAVIVFTGVFASWRLAVQQKEYFMWFCLLATGVFGFFISIDLFTMFLFYEVALIPMYLLIGVWGSGRKEYAAMKLTLMLMGGSAFLLVGILGIYFHSAPEGGSYTMNLLEIARVHIPVSAQRLFFPLTFLGFGVLGLVPFPYVVAGWSCFGSYCGFDVACGSVDEAGRLRLFPGGYLSDAGSGKGVVMDFYRTDRYQCGIWGV